MKKYIFIVVSLLLLSVGSSFAQRGFGTAVADSQAVLDLSHSAKGVLIPRVALSATDNISPFAATPATSMLVYNTASAGGVGVEVTPGYYYWDGTQWVRLLTTAPIPPVINNLINEPYVTYSASANLNNEKVFQDGTASTFTEVASNVQVDVRYDNTSVGVNGSNNLEVKDGGVSTAKISSSGANSGDVLTYNGTNVAWTAPTAGAEVDGVIGNEVTNATNSTLTRSGAGTSGSPYTLGLNLANANTWTGTQTFNSTVNINAVGGLVFLNGGLAFNDTSLVSVADGPGEKWNLAGVSSYTIAVATPSGGGTHTIYIADMPAGVASGTIFYVLNAAATNISIVTSGFPRDGSILQGRMGLFIKVGTQWYFND